MKRLVLVWLCASCGAVPDPPASPAWRIDARELIEDGAYLRPDDPTAPGEAGPSAMVRHEDALWIAYAHLRAYRPAGVGWLARHDATTLERTRFIELSLGDEQCRNPVALHREGELLYIACSGAISFDEPSDDGAVMTVSLETESVLAVGHVGHSPGSITRSGDWLWLGDGEVGGVWKVGVEDLAGATLVSPCVSDATHDGYVSDLLAHEGRLFAACFNDDTVVELDPASGEVVGAPLPTGDAPLTLRMLGDSLYVLDNLGGTLSVIDPGASTARAAAIHLGRAGEQGGNDPQGLAGDATLIGVTNSAWGTFVVLDAVTEQLVAAVDLKATAEAASNFPTAVTYDDGVFHVLVPGLELDTNDVPGELIRIVKAQP